MKKFLFLLLLAFSSPLCAEIHILAFAGSTREGSYNKQLVNEAASIARELNAKVTVIDLKDFPLPLYNADLEAKQGEPYHASRLRELMIKSDAIIIASPQYNGSVTAVLKNTLEWLSRETPGRPSAFKGKKFAIMSASPGKRGGAKGLIHLRTILQDCGGEVIEEEVSIGNADKALKALSPEVKMKLTKQIQALLSLVNTKTI